MGHTWTDEERAIIRRDYKHTEKSLAQLATRLTYITGEKITPLGIRGQVTRMGIAKSTDRHPWTPEEEEQLRELVLHHCPQVVAQRMHRSINSVVVRSKRLKLSWRCRHGWYTKAEAMAILGHDHKWLQTRIDCGAIKASYHYGHRPSQKGGSAWHIERDDLKKFIQTYPEELVGCNIDIITIVDLLAGVENNQHGEKESKLSMLADDDKIIRDNPKHLKCRHCGHEEDIFAACAIPKPEGGYTLWFGSEADFCTNCDMPWGRSDEGQ